jgi:hypothetical protein
VRIGANSAGALLCERAADFAIADAVAGFDEDGRELFDGIGFRLDEVHREAFGGTRTDARETIEGGGEVENWLGERAQLQITNYELPITNICNW